MTDPTRLSKLEEEHDRLQEARSRGGRNRSRRWDPARRLALALLQAGELGQEEIARAVGVNRRTIWNWERAALSQNQVRCMAKKRCRA